MAKGVESKLNEYELQRLENIRKNQAIMEQMGLFSAKETLVKAVKPARLPNKISFPVKRKVIEPEPVRRSSRKSGKPVLYTPDELDEVVFTSQTKRPRREYREKVEVSPLGEDERHRLKDAQDWLEEFEEFLLHVPHGRNGKVVSEANARTVMRQVKILVSGSGVEYQHWTKGVVFAKDRPVTLASDFVSLYSEAVDFEREHGEDKGHGWLLTHPITKLLCFQLHKHEQLDVKVKRNIAF